ncbi:hypothetical protein [Nocardia sp. NPDC004860]
MRVFGGRRRDNEVAGTLTALADTTCTLRHRGPHRDITGQQWAITDGFDP